MRKKVKDLTDKELLDMMDVPEEKLAESVEKYTTDVEPDEANSGEMADIVLGILEERHGEAAANRMWEKRFGGTI